jgi:hypothetical protein
MRDWGLVVSLDTRHSSYLREDIGIWPEEKQIHLVSKGGGLKSWTGGLVNGFAYVRMDGWMTVGAASRVETAVTPLR